MHKENRGLKVVTNFKAGAAASNPSLLNPNQAVVGSLKLRRHVSGGISPCTAVVYSDITRY